MSVKMAPEQAVGDVVNQMCGHLFDQLATYVQHAKRPPRFIHVNDKFFRDAPPKLLDTINLLNVTVRTSKHMPYDQAFLTYADHPTDELGKHLASGGTIGLI